MLKILEPLVTEKTFICLLWFEFYFVVLEKLRSCCLIETSSSSKYCLGKDICKPLFVLSLRVSAINDSIRWNLWKNATNVYCMKRKLAINMQTFAVSKVLGGTYCNRTVCKEWNWNWWSQITFYMVTYDDLKQSRIDCHFCLLQMINSCWLYIAQWQQMRIYEVALKTI